MPLFKVGDDIVVGCKYVDDPSTTNDSVRLKLPMPFALFFSLPPSSFFRFSSQSNLLLYRFLSGAAIAARESKNMCLKLLRMMGRRNVVPRYKKVSPFFSSVAWRCLLYST